VSTILKALRRVEEDHPGQPQRRSMRGDIVAGGGKPPAPGTVGKQHAPGPGGKPHAPGMGGKPPSPRRSKARGPNLPLWSSLGAALLLTALVWWRLPGAEDADLVEALPPSGVEQAATPAAAPAAQPPTPQPPADPGPRHSAGPGTRPSADQLAAATEPAVVPPPAPAVPDVAPAIDPSLPAELAVRLPPLGETLDAPVPEPPVAVAPPAPPTEPVAPPAPSRSSEPAAVRSEPRPPPPPQPAAPVAKPPPVAAKRVLAPPPPSAPEVQVERTSWHPKPERRVAWVRLEGSVAAREVHEGDALGTLVVKEIRPSAVVFLHGTAELQRRVGEH
jgi:hypothetical protein